MFSHAIAFKVDPNDTLTFFEDSTNDNAWSLSKLKVFTERVEIDPRIVFFIDFDIIKNKTNLRKLGIKWNVKTIRNQKNKLRKN